MYACVPRQAYKYTIDGWNITNHNLLDCFRYVLSILVYILVFEYLVLLKLESECGGLHLLKENHHYTIHGRGYMQTFSTTYADTNMHIWSFLSPNVFIQNHIISDWILILIFSLFFNGWIFYFFNLLVSFIFKIIKYSILLYTKWLNVDLPRYMCCKDQIPWDILYFLGTPIFYFLF